MDEVFEQEQQHLKETYGKLVEIERKSSTALQERMGQATGDRSDMMDELTLDLTGEVNVETYVEIEAMHKIIDAYNLANDMDIERMERAHLLRKQPYFAKVSLKFKPGQPARDLYIGVAGMVDDERRRFIVDWRSPVAEVYYNQASGKTSYQANGRTIECELETRRQFDIEHDKLNAYFDTTVAIEDPMLLASLSHQRSDQMADITATIQKEQNLVVRHEDVPVMLVNGIAGSGKTSVLLQRIAYLLYQERETLDPRDVFLVTPNPVFESYIANVLPSMGESNPQTRTWARLTQELGAGERGVGADLAARDFELIDECIERLSLSDADFCDIAVEDEVVISATQAKAAWNKYRKFPSGPHRAQLAVEDLLDRLEQRVKRLIKDEDTQNVVTELTPDEQLRYFGQHIAAISDEDVEEYVERYLAKRYTGVEERIEACEWLRVERIGMRALKKESLSGPEWLYLKMSLTGNCNGKARFVMIDEVQDYTYAQLKVLAAYFCNAHFLLLGDPNQAINRGTAGWANIRAVFEEARGSITECELMTSYRSTPEITQLFTALMEPNDRLKTSSVQRSGTAPRIQAYDDEAAWGASVRDAVRGAAEQGGLAAVVAADKRGIKRMVQLLDGEDVVVLDGVRKLPESGVVLVDVALAKGLEFDEVIIPDATSGNYRAGDEVHRHRLYTAMSRATQRLSVFALGQLTELLGK